MLAFIVLLGTCSPEANDESSAPPNIIFILADDLGYGDLGSYGQEQIQPSDWTRWPVKECDSRTTTQAARWRSFAPRVHDQAVQWALPSARQCPNSA